MEKWFRKCRTAWFCLKLYRRGDIKETQANGLMHLTAVTELGIIKTLHMRARDGHGSRKQSCACPWSKGAMSRERQVSLACGAKLCVCPSRQNTLPSAQASLNASCTRTEVHPTWDCSS